MGGSHVSRQLFSVAKKKKKKGKTSIAARLYYFFKKIQKESSVAGRLDYLYTRHVSNNYSRAAILFLF